MRAFLLVIFLFSVHFTEGQNYNHVDSIVDAYPKKFKSIESFSNKIGKDFDTEIEKIRAAYYWIANHIFYDYKMYHSNKSAYKSISYYSEEEYRKKQLKQEKKYAELCLNKKKAICEGYAQLLKFTLLNLGIECEVVSGFSKTKLRDVGRERQISDHAWNAVKHNDEWKLIDATWSTGNKETENLKFNFTDVYFLTNPQQFILNHFPENKKWQLLDKPLSKSQFFNLPLVHRPYFNGGIEISKFNKGILKLKKDDTILLPIKDYDILKTYKYIFKNEKITNILNFNSKNERYFCTLPYHEDLGNTISILNSDGSSLITYKIEI